MQSDLNRAITQIIQECPAAAHVIQAELSKRVEVVYCGQCVRRNEWRRCQGMRKDDFCSYGKREK